MEPIEIPITDVLDLHYFRPKEVPGLLLDYFEECVAKEIFSVRVIHGKGRGILKQKTLRCLKKNPFVVSHKPAPGDAGGWGATLVFLKSPSQKDHA